jgi:hypothetical protein
MSEAGQSLGWEIHCAGPGHIRHAPPGNVAEVDIAYTTTTYSINYKDSRGLDYDGSNIHSNYNGWVQKLDRAIAGQLATL